MKDRREFLKYAATGATITVLGGGAYAIAGPSANKRARAQKRPDGRNRLPPGQKVLAALKPMGGSPGNPRLRDFRLKIHGHVKKELTLDFEQLLKVGVVHQTSDVHCVTGWSVLGAKFSGVPVAKLLSLAAPTAKARHVIFEAAHGYTANVPLADALKPDVLISHRINDRPYARRHGAPVRSIVPHLYFWKSAKWITGIRLVERDEPGYWETRGYHNYGDPWKEQRYS